MTRTLTRTAAPSSTRMRLLGCPLDRVSMRDALEIVDEAVRTRQSIRHGALNAAKVLAARSDPPLMAALEGCDLVTADGQAIVWAARLLGMPVPERVTGIDLMAELLSLAEKRGYSVFILGARATVLEAALAAIRRKHPALRIAGWQHGYFPAEDEAAVVETIRATAPDILFVAMETPAKELFLERHVGTLGWPAFAMGVGGAVDVLAGVRRRAPTVLQRFGLEWLYRFAQDPRRLAARYLVGNAAFLRLLAAELLARRHPKMRSNAAAR